jgi:hypothetical protein
MSGFPGSSLVSIRMFDADLAPLEAAEAAAGEIDIDQRGVVAVVAVDDRQPRLASVGAEVALHSGW